MDFFFSIRAHLACCINKNTIKQVFRQYLAEIKVFDNAYRVLNKRRYSFPNICTLFH